MASYMYNNDLVGKNRPWGKHSALLPWQKSLCNRYYKMCARCNNPNCSDYPTYGAKGIENHFTSLSHYYNTLKKDPLWQDFKKHPDKYHIDKDLKCGHGVSYEPGTIIITTKEENDREVAVRTGLGNAPRRVQIDGVVYSNIESVYKSLGLSKSTVCHHAAGGYTINGVWRSLSHTWTDKKGIKHTAEYI